jgi:hypothetical protein
VLSVSSTTPTLEDVFVSVIRERSRT